MAFLPEIFLGSLRLGATAATVEALYKERLLFAAHFAAVSELVTWPRELNDALAKVRKRYAAHDAVLKLIETLRAQVPMTLSAELARRMAEGMEVHSQHLVSREDYQARCRSALDNFTALQRLAQEPATPSARLAHLAQLLAFSRAETQLLIHGLGYAVMPDLQVLTRLFVAQRWNRAVFWQTLLDLHADELAQALSAQGRLAGSGVLVTPEGLPRMTDFWVELIVKTDTSFHDALLVPLMHKQSPGGMSRLPAEDWEILQALLVRPEPSINVLMYGKPAIDKRSLAWRLTQAAGVASYTLIPDVPERDRIAAVMAAQRLLAQHPGRAVLVVEKAQSILTRVLPDAFAFFGLVDDDEEARPIDERLLSENPVPTLWLTHDAQRLHKDTLTRFLFHAEALKGTRADRKAMVNAFIAALPLSARHKAELVKLEGLSEQQLASAQRLAELTAGRRRQKTTFARNVLIAATRSQKALARRDKDEARLPVTTYSLDYIHAPGIFGPAQILQALKHRPHGSVCLYGLPGTGKTQFAEHLAMELGKPLLVKHASQLFDKYVGESEKRIAEAFDQADEEGAILLLDEADSFLRDRSLSQHQWEVSTVNEMLQRMERFEGIFICTTNLFAQVDIAALRRFTFKLEFLPLTLAQRWAMFLNETGLRGKALSEDKQDVYQERLALMKDLTPGDFATVKRQCVLLGQALLPTEWLSQLELEVQAKHPSATQDLAR